MVWVVMNDTETWCAAPNLLLRLIQTFSLFLSSMCAFVLVPDLWKCLSSLGAACVAGLPCLPELFCSCCLFLILVFLEAVLKEFHFLGLHLLPPGLFEMLEKEPFYLFIC